ncbi:MAG: hypothetical protein K0R38_5780 [Polyangiaceae bacterium]|nr:hypothetical protein [Polyangiaceae bacterium]
MRNTVIWSFFSIVALASGGLLSGCDSDDALARSALGESCDKTSDCSDGLKCIQGTCYQSQSSGGSSNEGGDGSGGTVVLPKPPEPSGEGENCTKRADCEEGLGCFNGRCTTDAGGTGGSNGGVTLGSRGETCGLSSDCAKGLACLPQDGGNNLPLPLAAGSNSIGVCTPVNSGIEPTGKSCFECAEAADCCQLPLIEQAAVGAKSCADLASLAYSAYCSDQCGDDTWACDSGLCQYTGECTASGNVAEGCPAYSRTGRALPTACDVKSGVCGGAPVVGCKKDSECVSTVAKPVLVSDDPTDTCVDDECVCYTESGGCYRKCAEDLDCAAGFVCDGDTSLCVAADSCTSDAQCAVAYGDIRYKCQDDGICKPGCENDIDCSYGSLEGGFEMVCGPDKTCVNVGCSDDAECTYPAYDAIPALLGTVRGFCAEAVEVEPVGGVRSAITD